MKDKLPVLDRSVLRTSLGDDNDLINEILGLFKSTTPEIIAALDKAADEGNTDEVRICAHSLKGSAVNIGAIALMEAMKDIEDACAGKMSAGVRGKVTAALIEYNILKSELETD